MNKYKLILSSIKNQFHIYGIYIISLTLAFTFYLTFINLSTSFINVTKQFNSFSRIYVVVTLLIGILLAAVIVYLINYVQSLLITARSKELAVYRLVSFSNKELRKYLLTEQLVINGFCFILATILSVLFTNILLVNFNETVVVMLSVELNLQIQLPIILYEVLSLIVISLFVTKLATRKIFKKELIDLLLTKHAIPEEADINNSIINALIVFATWIGLLFILAMQFDRLKLSTMGLVIVIYIISIFTVYNVLAKIVIKLIPNKVYYRGANSFTTSLISRKLNANSLSMAFVTVLIVVSTFTMMFGVLNYKFIEYFARYSDATLNTIDTELVFKYNDQPYTLEYNDDYFEEITFFSENSYTISEYSFNKFTQANDFNPVDLEKGEAIVISTDDDILNQQQIEATEQDYGSFTVVSNYKVTSDYLDSYDGTITVVDDSYNPDSTQKYDDFKMQLSEDGIKVVSKKFKRFNASVINDGTKISDYANVMSQSTANNYLHQIGITSQFNLDDNSLGYLGTLPYQDDSDIKLQNDQVSYNLSQAISDERLKNLGFGMYVLPDSVYDNYQGYVIEYLNWNFTDEYDKQYWQDINKKDLTPQSITFKDESNTAVLLTTVIVSGSTIFISLIMLLLLITMIGIQVNIDSLETKEQFKNLSKIGYSKKSIHNIINKLTSIYFIIPLIIGIINVVLLYIVFIKYLMKYTTLALLFSTGAITNAELGYIALFMLIIYVLYSVLVNYSYKRVVDKD